MQYLVYCTVTYKETINKYQDNNGKANKSILVKEEESKRKVREERRRIKQEHIEQEERRKRDIGDKGIY